MKKVKYHYFNHRRIFLNLIVTVPLLIIGIFVFFRWEKGDLLFWIASTVFSAGAIGYLIWKRYRVGLFRCPKCGKTISEIRTKKIEQARPTNYYCSQCDIEWEMDYLPL